MKLSLLGLVSLVFLPALEATTIITKVQELVKLHDGHFDFELVDNGKCFHVSPLDTKQWIDMAPCDLTDSTMQFTYHFETKTLRPSKYPDRCVFVDDQSPHLCTKACAELTAAELRHKPLDFDAMGRIVTSEGKCVQPDTQATTADCSSDAKQVFKVESEVDLPLDVIARALRTGGGKGDPHFSLWNGTKYDFHGGCDLVLLNNPHFSDGLGMTIHVRTKINDWWSSIDSVAIQIGEEKLEVMGTQGDDWYWLNDELIDANTEEDQALSGYRVHFTQVNEKVRKVRIDLGLGDAIGIQTFKGMVEVNAQAHTNPPQFAGSYGLMGRFPDGMMLARDKKTLIDNDPTAYGKEWQVRDTEPMLFHQMEGVQYPQTCAMPDTAAAGERKRRRLGEAILSTEDAEQACSGVRKADFHSCVFDVMAMNDLEAAGAY